MIKFRKYLYVVALIWTLILYVGFMPALNIHSLGFWNLILFALVPFAFISFDYSLSIKEFFKNGKNKLFVMATVVVTIIVLLADVIGMPMTGGLNAYRNRLTIPESSEFSEIEEFDKTQVQIIDKQVSMSLADRVFGEMGADIVSQYDISNNYASVVVDGTMYRLTPVEYSGFIKWLSTKSKGTPGYIAVNVTTGDTKFVNVDNGLKYTPNAKLLNNLSVHLRLQFPTYMFGYVRFEVDDDWNPYWVSQVMSYKFIGKAADVKGVVITDPNTGESEYYDVEDVPNWVDNVYDANLISEQYNSYGQYINGLFNFSQRGMTAVTDDYAYLQKNGHLWMYTGVTSIGSDESNVGFIYVDLQNKDVIYIVSAGAEEYSARASAEGALQEKGYSAVFPTIVNVDGEPVYFMGLKDNAGLVKAYAFVSYKNYQRVGVGTTIEEALKNFTGRFNISLNDTEEKTITVSEVASAVKEGYTIYYIKTSENEYYYCSIEISEKLPFIKQGDVLDIRYDGKQIIEIK